MAGLTAFEFTRAVQDTCHHSELVVSYEVQLLKTDWDGRPFSPNPYPPIPKSKDSSLRSEKICLIRFIRG
jgi:hypothetical protein